MDSATENIPPFLAVFVMARVKRCGKSAPHMAAMPVAVQAPFGARPSRRMGCPPGNFFGNCSDKWAATDKWFPSYPGLPMQDRM